MKSRGMPVGIERIVAVRVGVNIASVIMGLGAEVLVTVIDPVGELTGRKVGVLIGDGVITSASLFSDGALVGQLAC